MGRSGRALAAEIRNGMQALRRRARFAQEFRRPRPRQLLERVLARWRARRRARYNAAVRRQTRGAGMTWQLSLVFMFVVAFAAGLVISISAMLALKIGDGIIAAWRWAFGQARARQ